MSEPSFSNGFASPWYGGRMKYPGLWRGCVGSWSPLLGPTGATLFDQSGRPNWMTINNANASNVWAVDRYGHTFYLDGTDDTASTTASVTILDNPKVSVSIWMKPASEPVSDTVANKGPSSATSGWLLSYSNSEAGKLRWIVHNGGLPIVTTTSALTAGQWWHVVGTYDGTTARMYVNGIETGTPVVSSGSVTANTNAVVIGNYTDNPSGGFIWSGQVADFALFNRALSPNEIKFLAQRPGIMLELDDSDTWGSIEAGGSVPWWAFANRQSRIIGGGVT